MILSMSVHLFAALFLALAGEGGPTVADPTAVDPTGQWAFTIKWIGGGRITPHVQLVKDEDFRGVELDEKDRQELPAYIEKEGYVSYSGTAQWKRKDDQSEWWVVLVKSQNLLIVGKDRSPKPRSSLTICTGAFKDAHNAAGKCRIPMFGIVAASGTFEAQRSDKTEQKN